MAKRFIHYPSYEETFRRRYLILFFFCSFLLFLLPSCGNDAYTPKPRGYFRIELPEKQYKVFDSLCPYTFEYPLYARVLPDVEETAEPYWLNLEFPSFNGTLYISYKVVDNNLNQYWEDSRNFVTKHIPKANDISTTSFSNDSAHVWGIVYHIEGSGVASTCQFCLTDSTTHFVRGALYFNTVPNNDSLAPVLEFINKDIDHLISTFRWKDRK